jgi:hypothetical protein
MYLAISWCLQYVCRNSFTRNMVQWTWGAFSTFQTIFYRVPVSKVAPPIGTSACQLPGNRLRIIPCVHPAQKCILCKWIRSMPCILSGKPNFNPFHRVSYRRGETFVYLKCAGKQRLRLATCTWGSSHWFGGDVFGGVQEIRLRLSETAGYSACSATGFVTSNARQLDQPDVFGHSVTDWRGGVGTHSSEPTNPPVHCSKTIWWQ